jgi:hypothetical protein
MDEPRQKIIYIAGLGHSGSTILDLSLGAHSKIIGLGEIFTLLDKDRRKNHLKSHCSCGMRATQCKFWAGADLELDKGNGVENKYAILVQYFRRKFGDDYILVDSSKNSYSYIEFLKDHFDLVVIYLTRDFRSWIYARHLNNGKPLITLAIRWFLENKKLLYQFKQMDIDIFTVGYEELALYPELILKNIADHAGIRYQESMLSPEQSNSHIISGNIARTDPDKKRRFIYDARWLISVRLLLLSPFLILLSRFNKKYVYSNVNRKGLSEFYLFGANRKKSFSDKYN